MPSPTSTKALLPTLSASLKIVALLIGLGIPLLVTHTLHRQYTQALSDAEVRAANTALTVEQHAARTVETIDAYLRAVVALVGPRVGDVAPEVIHAALKEQLTHSRHLINLMVIDREGRSIFEADAYPVRALDVSDRDYFRVLRDTPGAGLVVGRVVAGRLTGKSAMPIARRMEDLDGSFAGVVQAVLDPDAFQSVYDAIDNGPGATLSLWRSDGTLLVRSPHMPEVIGKSFASSENFKRHVPSRDTKPFWSVGSTDSVERVIAFSFLEGYPLYVSAALGRADALADWMNAAVMQASVAGGLTLVLVVVLLLLARETKQRRSADAAIRTSEARYRLLAQNTSDVVILCDLDTTRRYVSPAAEAVFGHAPETLIGMRPLDFVHPDDAEAYRRVLDDLTSERVERTVSQQRYRRADGSYVWIEASFALTRNDKDGRATGYVASLRDVSDRKAAEAAAAESEARYREALEATQDAVLDQIAEGVILTDAAGRLTLVNEAAAAIHGMSRLDIEEDGYSDTYGLYTEDGHPFPPHDLPLARAVRGEVVTDARWRVRRPDGAEVLAIGSARPLRGRDGFQIGAVLTLRDDTAREAAERELRDLNATLSQRVAERTREAEGAQIEAERASAAKSEFLASMSHEIRTPLSGVLGYADLLLEEPLISPAARRHAERIQSAGAALLTVVNDILDFSKIEAGEIELHPKSFAVSGLIDNAISIVRASAEQKGLALRVEVSTGLSAYLIGDQDRLRQVLLNLLNNAIKFTRAGQVALVVEALPGDPGLAHLRFAIQDTGIGIQATKRHLLFGRFSQVDGSIQREFGGTGLGLAICKRLVELMGGRIDVESEEGRGSTFWFEISLPQTDQEPTLTAALAREPSSTQRRLLLVEDVPLNQELALAVLGSAGHSVDVVSGGADAVAAVQTKEYDLVLMDIQMPGMDGITATRLIRLLDHPAASVPIVAMTANVLTHQVEEFRAAAMQDHIGKPFRRDALLAVVERWAVRSKRADVPIVSGCPDRGVFDEMLGLIGLHSMDRLLCGLAEELERRFGTDGVVPDREQLARDAHAMMSASGTLGFTALAEVCREVETAIAAGSEYEELVLRLHEMRRLTISEIDVLRAA